MYLVSRKNNVYLQSKKRKLSYLLIIYYHDDLTSKCENIDN